MENWLSTVEKYKATHTSLPPIIATGIIKSPLTDRYDISSLRMVISSAWALNPDIQRTLIRKIKPVKGPEENEPRITQLWGMTEATCIVTKFNHPELDGTGSVGRLIPGIEAKYAGSLPRFFPALFSPLVKEQASPNAVISFISQRTGS